MAILDQKRLQTPRLLTQCGSVDNHGNPRAQWLQIIPRTFPVQELIHETSAPTCPAGRSCFIRSIPAGPGGPCRFVTRRRIFQVSGQRNLSSIREREHKKTTRCKERQPACKSPAHCMGGSDEKY